MILPAVMDAFVVHTDFDVRWPFFSSATSSWARIWAGGLAGLKRGYRNGLMAAAGEED